MVFEDLNLLPDDPPPDMIRSILSRVKKILSSPNAKDATREDLLKVNRIILNEVERLGAEIVSGPAIKAFVSVEEEGFAAVTETEYSVEADGVYFEYSDYHYWDNVAMARFYTNPFERIPFRAFFDNEKVGIPLYDGQAIYRKFRKIRIEYYAMPWPLSRNFLHTYFLRGIKISGRSRQIWQDRLTEYNVPAGAKLRDGRQLVETDVGRVIDVTGSTVTVNQPVKIDPSPTDYSDDWDSQYTTVLGATGNQNVITAVPLGTYRVAALTVWHASSQQFQFHWESSATIIWMLGVNSYNRCHTIVFPPPFIRGPNTKRLQVNTVQAGTGFVSVAYLRD